MSDEGGRKVVARNRKARHEYDILDTDGSTIGTYVEVDTRDVVLRRRVALYNYPLVGSLV